MKKSELRKLIREVISEQEAKSPRVIYDPTPEQIGVSQEEYDSFMAKLMTAKGRLDEGKMPLNERRWWQCGNCGGAKFGGCIGGGCAEPFKWGIKFTWNF
jgi:hypothetical protein